MHRLIRVGLLPLLALALLITASPAAAADDGDEFLGTWDLAMETPQGSREMKLIVARDDAGALTAKIEGGMGRGGRGGGGGGGGSGGGGGGSGGGGGGAVEAQDVSVSDGVLSFNITRQTQRGEMSMDYKLELDDDKLSGGVSMPFGEMEITGTRTDT